MGWVERVNRVLDRFAVSLQGLFDLGPVRRQFLIRAIFVHDHKTIRLCQKKHEDAARVAVELEREELVHAPSGVELADRLLASRYDRVDSRELLVELRHNLRAGRELPNWRPFIVKHDQKDVVFQQRDDIL